MIFEKLRRYITLKKEKYISKFNDKKKMVSSYEYYKSKVNPYLKFDFIRPYTLIDNKNKRFFKLHLDNIQDLYFYYNNLIDEYYLIADSENWSRIVFKILPNGKLVQLYNFRDLPYHIFYKYRNPVPTHKIRFMPLIHNKFILLKDNLDEIYYYYRAYIYKTPVLFLDYAGYYSSSSKKIYNIFTKETIFGYVGDNFDIDIYEYIWIMLKNRRNELVNLFNPINYQLYLQSLDDIINEYRCTKFKKILFNALI
jgi:hypothetical protein